MFEVLAADSGSGSETIKHHCSCKENNHNKTRYQIETNLMKSKIEQYA